MPAVPSSSYVSSAPLFIKTLLVRRPLLTQPLTPLAQQYYPYQFQLYNSQARINASELWLKPNAIPDLDTASESNAKALELPNSIFSSSSTSTSSSTELDQDITKVTRKLHDFLFLLIHTPKPSLSSSSTSSTSSTSTSTSTSTAKSKTKSTTNSNTPTPIEESTLSTSTWDLVTSQVEVNEPLHKAAQRSLRDHCGSNMELWMVGRAPIAISHLQPNTYIHKAHILAGEPQSLKSSSSLTKYIWVTAEEMPQYLSKERFEDIKDLLSY